MNLDKLFSWIAGIVIAFAVVGQLDVLQVLVGSLQTQKTLLFYELTKTILPNPTLLGKVNISVRRSDIFELPKSAAACIPGR